MENNWHISKSQKELLDSLFNEIQTKEIKSVLDVGSGRTSLQYLTDRFKDLTIQGIVYPGDTRKTDPIRECVVNINYKLIESDIKDYNSEEHFDVVLGHLFLGEAEKFNKNQFQVILEKLFSIKTDYFVLVNFFNDHINYDLLLKEVAMKDGVILRTKYIVSDSGEDCLGMLIKIGNK